MAYTTYMKEIELIADAAAEFNALMQEAYDAEADAAERDADLAAGYGSEEFHSEYPF